MTCPTCEEQIAITAFPAVHDEELVDVQLECPACGWSAYAFLDIDSFVHVE
jgi:Zn ribbon nucleic-acid-binding protein